MNFAVLLLMLNVLGYQSKSVPNLPDFKGSNDLDNLIEINVDDEYQNDKNDDINNYGYDYYFYDIRMPPIEQYYVVEEQKDDDDSDKDNDDDFDFDECYKEFSKSALKIHNKLRKKHGSRPLALTTKQNNLLKLNADKFLVHSFESLNDTISSIGNQNLYKETFKGIDEQLCHSYAFNSIQSWYNTSGMIDFTHGNLDGVEFGLTVTSKDKNDNRWLIVSAEYQ